MYAACIRVSPKFRRENAAFEAFHQWLATLQWNGQILSSELVVTARGDFLTSVVCIPTPDALDAVHDGAAGRASRADLLRETQEEPDISPLGTDPESETRCYCDSPSAYILYPDGLSLESPVRCADCFGPVPLYHLPPTSDGHHSDITAWQSVYRALEQLRQSGDIGEQFALAEMTQIDSRLTQQGRALCAKIEEALCLPAYYYVYRYDDRPDGAESRNGCPRCGGAWDLMEPWHDAFDFRCDNCRLLSDRADSPAQGTRNLFRDK